MGSVYDTDNFEGRVNYAAAVIAKGGNKSGNSRHFDTCFEMSDGDWVLLAVYRRSLKNPKLAANIGRYLNAESLAAAATKGDIPRRDFARLAADARREAREAFSRFLQEQGR